MEVRKTSQQIIQPEIPQKSEVTKTKSSGQNLIPDSFEKENSQSSSSNSSSTVSAEPEKKAGQITGGILIKQMTAARLGETTTGKQELSAEQQSRVSKSDPQKENLKPSYFQDARSRYEDSKNSGLQVPSGSNKGDASSKFTNVSRVGKDQVNNATGSDQTSNAIKDANRFADGGSIRSQVDAEVADRHQDTNAIGGSKNDQLSNLLNPTAAGPQQSGQTHGKGAIAEGLWDDKKQEVKGNKSDSQLGPGLTNFLTTGNDATRKQTFRDAEKDFYDQDGRKETTGKDGTVVIKDGGDITVIKDGTKTVTHKDGSYEEYGADGKLKGKGGPLKSYDQENYTGNIPDEVKETMEYFKQQAIGQKPQSGGETAHTDDNANADPTVGRGVSNLVTEQGNLGLFGNPGSATSQTGAGNGRAPVGSSQGGGDVDLGPDSDQVGYTGATHQDDPADVQFGPAEQPKEQTAAKKSEDADDSSASNLDPLHNKKRRDI